MHATCLTGISLLVGKHDFNIEKLLFRNRGYLIVVSWEYSLRWQGNITRNIQIPKILETEYCKSKDGNNVS